MSEASRLEQLWAGGFGDAYVERNRDAGAPRGPFWNSILNGLELQRVLEIGCNVGANLQWIAQHVPPSGVYGVDVNASAVAEVRRRLPGVNALLVPARDLPFREGWFDLVFTCGVLIHQPELALPLVMGDMVRCSRRYVLCVEYFAEETVEVPYRGERGALFKRDYGRLFQELFASLRLLKRGFLSREEGWDDATYWLFEKT
ncbi:MAG TPA: pseudaminic acid biosynthesis-associated methylase [Thermoanaerobaculia bacterium]|nr:pseudaminic acid biosynthesis-associated methylase [Thermoanaerobaculia bacterium]